MYVDIHTHRRRGEGIEVVSVMAGQRPTGGVEPPYSIGVHPWQLSREDFDLAEALREVETAPAALIGEIGLDFAPAVAAGHGEQKMVFAAQLRIAEARRLPVVLHCVRAFEPAMEILSVFRLTGVIFHGFVGSHRQAAQAAKAGQCLSFGPRSLNSPKTVEALRAISPDRLFLETDDDPVAISDIYARVGQILNIPLETLERTILENYARLVGKN